MGHQPVQYYCSETKQQDIGYDGLSMHPTNGWIVLEFCCSSYMAVMKGQSHFRRIEDLFEFLL